MRFEKQREKKKLFVHTLWMGKKYVELRNIISSQKYKMTFWHGF